MEITIELHNEATASEIVKAVRDKACRWELLGTFYTERIESEQGKVDDIAINYYSRRLEECKTMSEYLYRIAEHIKEECKIIE